MISLCLHGGAGRVIFINPAHIITMQRNEDGNRTFITTTNLERQWSVIETPTQICKLIRDAKANG